MANQTAFSYLGGKGTIADVIVKRFPKYDTIVDVFGGAANITMEVSGPCVYNDKWELVVNFFRVLQNEKESEQLKKRLNFTMVSRSEMELAWKTCINKESSNIDKAWGLFVVLNQGFGGMFKEGFGTRKDVHMTTSAWLGKIAKIDKVVKRFKNVVVENRSFEKVIELYDTKKTLFYCDPPYAWETRSSNAGYECEFNTSDHDKLVDVLLNIEGMAILSGYKTKAYKPLEDAGWKTEVFEKRKQSGNNSDITYEYIWLSPQAIQKQIRQRNLF